MPKQDKGAGIIIPPPRRSREDFKRKRRGGKSCRPAALLAGGLQTKAAGRQKLPPRRFTLFSARLNKRETRVGWVDFLSFKIKSDKKSDKIIALNFGG